MPMCDLPRSFRKPLLLVTGLLTLACTDAGDPLAPKPFPGSSVATMSTGDVYILLQTDPHATAGTFSFAHTFGANSNPEVPSPFTLQDGRLSIFNSVVAGSYTVTVSVPADWDLVASGAGDDTVCWDDQGNSSIDLSSGVATIDVASGESVVCTFVLRKRATLSLAKRESGALPLSQPWAFELRTGASQSASGVVRAAATANQATGEVSFACVTGANPDCAEAGGVVWLRAQEYQLCEVGMPAGASNNLDGFTPANAAAEGQSNGAECVNVTLPAAGSATTLSLLGLEFVDNVLGSGNEDPPPPDPVPATPRTISNWRTHEGCSSAAATAHKGPGANSSGALEQLLASHPELFPLGLITSMDCEQAIRILSRQDFAGTNRASDGAYTLAAQLLAARLNRAAGAAVPECVATVMSAAQDLLGSAPSGVGFTGTGEYLGPKSNKDQRATATALASVLERYNSQDPTVLANNCG